MEWREGACASDLAGTNAEWNHRYPESDELDDVIDAINGTGFGLTLGVHGRIDETIEHIAKRAKVGNTYVNRNQMGAVVGVQPFGGENLSGTGRRRVGRIICCGLLRRGR